MIRSWNAQGATALRSRRAAGALILAIAALASRAPAEEPDTAPPPTPLQELRSRIDDLDLEVARIHRKLELVDEKLDRLEALLRSVHGERLRRIERIAADAELAGAIGRLEARYALRGVGDALASDEIQPLVKLRGNLARAAAERGELEFARDPDVALLIAAVAERREFMVGHGRVLVSSIARGEAEAMGTLVAALLDLPGKENEPPPGHEAALWAAPRAKGRGLGGRLSDYARAVGEGNPRVAALAQAAASAHGDEGAAGRLVELVRSGAVKGLFARQIATQLGAAGAKAAFRVYLQLVLDKDYAYTAALQFGRIGGFGRRLLRSEIIEDRQKLHRELSEWLERNWSKLRHERGRFTVQAEPP